MLEVRLRYGGTAFVLRRTQPMYCRSNPDIRNGETLLGIVGDGKETNMAWFEDGHYFRGREHPWDIMSMDEVEGYLNASRR